MARLFVGQGHAGDARNERRTARDDRERPRRRIDPLPAVVLIDTGTSAAAEVFASALSGNQRADLIGEHTIGRAAEQKLIKLPDGAGLWLSTMRYLTPAGTPLHEKGLEPTVVVDDPGRANSGSRRRRPIRFSRRRSNTLLTRRPRSINGRMNKAGHYRQGREGHRPEKASAAAVVDSIIDGITKSLKKGDQVIVRRFGTFKISNRKARIARNPQTGVAIKIPKRRVPRFSAGKALRQAVK